MTETCDSGNYSQCESNENTTEIFQQQSSENSAEDSDDSEYSDDEDEEDTSDDDDDDDSELVSWIHKRIERGLSPKSIIQRLIHSFNIPDNINEETLFRIISLAFTPRRKQLQHFSTIEHATQLIRDSKNIIVLTGAGVSVSSGIPDFRSKEGGLYSRIAHDFPSLPDPQSMFDIKFFFDDPRPFYKFAREIFPGQFKPTPSHNFIKRLEESGKLLRNYTQNIDTLERIAGITRVVECHGTFQNATCTKCQHQVTSDAIRERILKQQIPVCRLCNDPSTEISIDDVSDSEELKKIVTSGILKPNIIFFGEDLPDYFHDSINVDRDECDLLIVIGSSMKVRPVAVIPNLIPANIPQILINREPLPHMNFDINLYGDADQILTHLCELVDDKDESTTIKEVALPELPTPEDAAADEEDENTHKISKLLPPNSYAKIRASHYMFEGAEITYKSIKKFDNECDSSSSSDSNLDSQPNEDDHGPPDTKRIKLDEH
jgi:NAD-dependent deacetylase sirtuin 1